MQSLRTAYTEVWTSTAVVPLVQFADVVRGIPSTGLDLVGIGDLAPPEYLVARVGAFDDVISWYGAGRPEFREAFSRLNPNTTYCPALVPAGWQGHASDFFAEQAGTKAADVLMLDLGDVVRRDTVVMHPFSGGERKNWPLASFQEVANGLPLPVEWTAGPEEQLEGAHRFSSLLELARWIAGCRLYIGNDSGITHLAAATRVPAVALFGPTDAMVWAPREATVLRSEPLSTLDPKRVLEAALRILGV